MKSTWAQQQISLAYCDKKNEKPCVVWVNRYFKDCLCSLRDEFSFAFGLISLVCWAVAEIPQIFTNFRTKSSHGVSLLFLLTWVAGDMFNLVGCLLEPATLPTQFYTAVLYTVTTILLVLQSFYYDYIHKWWTGENRVSREEDEDDIKKPIKPSKKTDSGIPIPNGSSSRIPPRYYTSARSLAGSATPPIRSYLWPGKSGPSAISIDDNSSSDDDTPETTTITTKPAAITRPKSIPTSAGYGAFLATSVNMPDRAKAMMQVYIGISGRKLLQHGGGGGDGTAGVVGQFLGWMMAAVYMGGRIPQIWLNMKRGSVEGLNPLMFIFALIANATYVASILVRTIEWDKIKANMPWLLDAVACVLLDLFIILQYIYYKRFYKRSRRDDDYIDVGKE